MLIRNGIIIFLCVIIFIVPTSLILFNNFNLTKTNNTRLNDNSSITNLFNSSLGFKNNVENEIINYTTQKIIHEEVEQDLHNFSINQNSEIAKKQIKNEKSNLTLDSYKDTIENSTNVEVKHDSNINSEIFYFFKDVYKFTDKEFENKNYTLDENSQSKESEDYISNYDNISEDYISDYYSIEDEDYYYNNENNNMQYHDTDYRDLLKIGLD